MIQFKKLIVHNFGSYGHTELDLQNRGFCLVSGQNNYAKDNALSNGSGKSFLWSAICYALTGETIGGIKTNLKNINIDESECYVQLDFVYHKDLFSLTRTITPKAELKILKNDNDLSGKGIRESEKKMLELLPELTKDLIASTIIIGQGMPNKFSSFSPSGRKELLEKLTKSDFMIEDLKSRISSRQSELSIKIREYEDSLVANNTQLNINLNNLTKLNETISQQKRPDFDILIAEQEKRVIALQQELTTSEQLIAANEQIADEANKKLLAITAEKSKVSQEELAAYNSSRSDITNNQVRVEFSVGELKKEIKTLKNITDICPTCGQSLPNVHKPDTSLQEAQLKQLEEELTGLKESLAKCDEQHRVYVQQINEAFTEEMTQTSKSVTDAKQSLQAARTLYNQNYSLLEEAKAAYNKLVFEKQNWDSFIQNQQNEMANLEQEIARLNNLINITNLSKEDYSSRLAIIKKMDTLVKRDFRGYLLTNIIKYVDNRAKEYCDIVFGTRDLSLALNGNALDITYCNKIFDGLSGGEKQRVDLILQLAIRDMLISYLDLSANILVLDEITDFLDKKSCQAVMQLLESKLQTVESVFIISHHAEELELPIDSEIHIIKNEQGISEVS